MLVEALLVSGAAAITSLLGVPIAVRLARLPSFTTTRQTTQRTERESVGTAGFEPLDLGPDLVQWPSATAWLSSNTIPIEWPSKSWNDEHFGRQWRDGTAYEVEDLGFHAMLQRRADAAEADAREVTARALAKSSGKTAPPPPSSAEQAFFQPQAQPQRQRPSQASPAQPEGWQPDADRTRQLRAQQELARRAAAQKQQEAIRAQAAKQAAAKSQRAPTPKAPPSRPARPQPAGNGPPNRAELEAMVEREGLAGTVQFIMRRTGWDFRKAAQYLARTRAQ